MMGSENPSYGFVPPYDGGSKQLILCDMLFQYEICPEISTVDANDEVARRLWSLATQREFLLCDLLGIFGLLGSDFVPNAWGGAVTSVGSALLAIGISLPVAVFYQNRGLFSSMKIVDSCNRAGIKMIYRSRLQDDGPLRAAIEVAAEKSGEIRLLGVAFPTLFAPSAVHTPNVRAKLHDPSVQIRVLLLNPDSEAARLRENVERDNKTIDDIRRTLGNDLPATIEERIKNLRKFNHGIQDQIDNVEDKPDEKLINMLIDKCNLHVRIYEQDPMMLYMLWGGSVFVEQYHLGRAGGLPAGSCIGKNVPVIEYNNGAESVEFWTAHFEKLWKLSEEKTNDVVLEAMDRLIRYGNERSTS